MRCFALRVIRSSLPHYVLTASRGCSALQFIIHGTKLASHLKNYSYSVVLNNQMDELSISKFKK